MVVIGDNIVVDSTALKVVDRGLINTNIIKLSNGRWIDENDLRANSVIVEDELPVLNQLDLVLVDGFLYRLGERVEREDNTFEILLALQDIQGYVDGKGK